MNSLCVLAVLVVVLDVPAAGVEREGVVTAAAAKLDQEVSAEVALVRLDFGVVHLLLGRDHLWEQKRVMEFPLSSMGFGRPCCLLIARAGNSCN